LYLHTKTYLKCSFNTAINYCEISFIMSDVLIKNLIILLTFWYKKKKHWMNPWIKIRRKAKEKIRNGLKLHKEKENILIAFDPPRSNNSSILLFVPQNREIKTIFTFSSLLWSLRLQSREISTIKYAETFK